MTKTSRTFRINTLRKVFIISALATILKRTGNRRNSKCNYEKVKKLVHQWSQPAE